MEFERGGLAVDQRVVGVDAAVGVPVVLHREPARRGRTTHPSSSGGTPRRDHRIRFHLKDHVSSAQTTQISITSAVASSIPGGSELLGCGDPVSFLQSVRIPLENEMTMMFDHPVPVEKP